MTEHEKEAKQSLILEQRKSLRVTGVRDIDSFTETRIVLNTVLGELVIRGKGLHIISMVVESGDLLLSGHIDSLTYNEFSSNAGFIKRLFR